MKINKYIINRNFFILWFGRLVSLAGDHAFIVALSVFTLDNYDASHYGIILTIMAIPPLVFGIISGVISDSYNKKLIIVFTDLIHGIIFFLIFIFAFNEILNYYLLLILLFLAATSGTFFQTASFSIIPFIVDYEKLPKANSIMNSTNESIKIIGPVIGGIIISTVGSIFAFLFNSITFILSGISEFFIEFNYTKSKNIKHIDSLVEGYKFLYKNKSLFGVALIAGILNFVGTPLFLFFPVYAKNIFKMGTFGISITFAALALGNICFSIFVYFKKELKNRALFIFYGTAICGILAVLIGLVNIFYIFVGIVFLIGIAFGINILILNLIIHTTVEHEYLGRVTSFLLTMFLVMMPLGYGIFSYLLKFYSVQLLTIVSGILIFIVSLCFLLVPNFKKL